MATPTFNLFYQTVELVNDKALCIVRGLVIDLSVQVRILTKGLTFRDFVIKVAGVTCLGKA